MEFRRVSASPALGHIIECFWRMKGEETLPEKQKIIPDAFTELVFHFGDPYRIRLRNKWEVQTGSLLAGQISKHFFLENTGRSDIFGIKLKPTTLSHLFGIGMDVVTDKVIDIQAPELLRLDAALRSSPSADRESVCENFFHKLKDKVPVDHPVDLAVREIFVHHGMVNISEIALALAISERYLEQIFKRFVGLSPKFFSRIVRFNYIFQLIRDNDPDWSEVVFKSGYYDQSHFIRNFKAFTGDDPSKYLFDRKDLANLFLREK